MMKGEKGKILILMNHDPTEEQLQDLRRMGFTEWELIKPGELDPEWDSLDIYDFFNGLIKGKKFNAIWCQGDYRLFAQTFLHCLAKRIPLYVSTTRRVVEEKRNPDGSITKVSIFKHVKFTRVI